MDCRRHHRMIGMRATRRLRNDLVHDLELEEIGSRDAERASRLLAHLGTLPVLPQDRGASFDRDHGVHRILQHQDTVSDTESQCATGAALSDDGRDDRDLEAAHLEQVASDRLGLPALLRAKAGPCTRRINEGQHGHVELLGELHESQRFPVALRVWHSEVAFQVFLGVASALVTDHHDGFTVQPRPTPDDRRVLTE